MRLSGFSPSNFTAPREPALPDAGTPTAKPPEAKSAGLAPLSFNRSALSGQSNLPLVGQPGRQTTPPLAQLISSLIGNLLSELTGSGALTGAPPLTAASGQMPFEQVITTLGRHEDLLKKPLDREGVEKLRNDPATPS
ncbi:MAG: hypothetical protein E7H57_03180, partial [Pantoea sp.]|nr:hypothetical protein [Pantoea sp.]